MVRNRQKSIPAVGVIELSVDEPEDLFHAFDPSPMVGRDLDNEVEAYIVESALELPQTRYALALHVLNGGGDGRTTDEIAPAIRGYFAYRLEVQSRRIRFLLREGRNALLVGLLFLLVCWGLGLLAQRLVAAPFGDFFREGLLIIGWVANWKPVEIFLYDWRPMVRQRNVLRALTEMEIELRHAAGTAGGVGTDTPG